MASDQSNQHSSRGQQQLLDFSRAEQLAILRTAQLPATNKVAGATLKMVLRTIDDHGRGREAFLTQETIARESNIYSTRQVRRAMKALEDLSVVICRRKRTPLGTTCNHYVIVWSELSLLAARASPSSGPDMRSDQADTGVRYQPDICADQPDICADQPDIGVRKKRFEALKKRSTAAATPVDAPPGGGESTSAWSAAAAAVLEIVPELELTCLERARQAGCTPAELLAIVRHWRARPGAWGVGALAHRLKHTVRGLPADRGWVRPRAAAVAGQQADRRRRAARNIEAKVLRRMNGYQAEPGDSMEDVMQSRRQCVVEALEAAGLGEGDLS